MTRPDLPPSVAHVLNGLETRTLPREEWTHGAHIAAALAIVSDPSRNAEAEMPDLIRAYNASVGVANTDTGGYHHTLTLAWLGGVRAFLSGRPGPEPLEDTLAALLTGPMGRSDWPLTFWSREVLFSVAARRGWVAPDLAPLPGVGPA
jgi:hypothetical protein